ncbi:MAG: hypothetical protein FD134_1882 [Gallionellaceae bacterium]|nr:MAG: hypothetical protein FD134_1882 [Gallionellaceae bacterium]
MGYTLGRMSVILNTAGEFIMGSIAIPGAGLGVVELYILFSLTTAIVGLIRVYAPIHKKLAERHISNMITASPMLSSLIFAALGFITSPFLFMVLVVPSVNHKFMAAMYESLAAPD